jgi:hypothetical protein
MFNLTAINLQISALVKEFLHSRSIERKEVILEQLVEILWGLEQEPTVMYRIGDMLTETVASLQEALYGASEKRTHFEIEIKKQEGIVNHIVQNDEYSSFIYRYYCDSKAKQEALKAICSEMNKGKVELTSKSLLRKSKVKKGTRLHHRKFVLEYDNQDLEVIEDSLI